MKKRTSLTIIAAVLAITLVGCGGNAGDSTDSADSQGGERSAVSSAATNSSAATTKGSSGKASDVAIKSSPDKYTWYIKNYVGKNCASIGYISMGGDYRDHYGAGNIKLITVTPDGSYVDTESDDDLKQYVVTGQSYAPNTELKYTFQVDSGGKEYDSLIQSQNIEQMVLCVKKVGTSKEASLGLTEITPSPDKYTWYIRDYTGQNLANCGYLSFGGERRDHYGAGSIGFVITSNDGSFIDPEDTELLKNYVIVGQSISPNTELKYTFQVDSEGTEYDNLIQSSSIEEIELTVEPISES